MTPKTARPHSSGTQRRATPRTRNRSPRFVSTMPRYHDSGAPTLLAQAALGICVAHPGVRRSRALDGNQPLLECGRSKRSIEDVALQLIEQRVESGALADPVRSEEPPRTGPHQPVLRRGSPSRDPAPDVRTQHARPRSARGRAADLDARVRSRLPRMAQLEIATPRNERIVAARRSAYCRAHAPPRDVRADGRGGGYRMCSTQGARTAGEMPVPERARVVRHHGLPALRSVRASPQRRAAARAAAAHQTGVHDEPIAFAVVAGGLPPPSPGPKLRR